MAFPSMYTQTAADALTALRQAAAMVRDQSANIRAKSLTGNLSLNECLIYLGYLRSMRAKMQALIAVPGIIAYAQAQFANVSLDVSAELTAMTSAIDATISWIAVNTPQSGGFIASTAIDAQGVTTDRVFTSVQYAGFRTQLDALLATIA